MQYLNSIATSLNQQAIKPWLWSAFAMPYLSICASVSVRSPEVSSMLQWWSLLLIKCRHWSRLLNLENKRRVCTCYQPGLFWVGYLLIQELFSLFRADVQMMIWKNVLKHSLSELENGNFSFPSRYGHGCGLIEEEFQSKSFQTATGCQDVKRVRVYVFLTSFFCVLRCRKHIGTGWNWKLLVIWFILRQFCCIALVRTDKTPVGNCNILDSFK